MDCYEFLNIMLFPCTKDLTSTDFGWNVAPTSIVGITCKIVQFYLQLVGYVATLHKKATACPKTIFNLWKKISKSTNHPNGLCRCLDLSATCTQNRDVSSDKQTDTEPYYSNVMIWFLGSLLIGKCFTFQKTFSFFSIYFSCLTAFFSGEKFLER